MMGIRSCSNILITMGDPDGIGPGVIVRSLVGRNDLHQFTVIGDKQYLVRELKRANLDISMMTINEEAFGDRLSHPEVQTKNCLRVLKPQIEELGSKADSTSLEIVAGLRLAMKFCRQDKAKAIVTAPIAKHRIAQVLPDFRGHTEFFADSCHVPFAMMLKAPQLAVVPLTGHIALSAVSAALNVPSICAKIGLVDSSLKNDFGIKRPRHAIAGVNPHAGDNGLIGEEDDKILAPSVMNCQQQGIDIEGPLAADTLFTPEIRRRYDCIFCPSHDQALIPIKALYFEEAVNVTLGLPFIRTSPDHGPAYSEVAHGRYFHGSMEAAINLAVQMVDAKRLS